MMNPFKDERMHEENMFMADAENDEEFDLKNFVDSMHGFMGMLSGMEGIDLNGNAGDQEMDTEFAGQAMNPEWLEMLDAMDQELRNSKMGEGITDDIDGNL